MKFTTKALLGAAAVALMAGSASAGDLACLITKNNTNPFFVKMKEGAEAAATAAGLDFQAYAGEKDGDAAPQITAIENCIAGGAKGILITPSNDSVGPALKDARAAGILVIALDTPLADTEAQDMTFATDNFEAGLLIGKWAAATMGDTSGAKIAMLDINKDNISVDVARDTGFLKGFGIEVPDLTVMGSETDARVIGHETSDANPEGGLRAMETLLAKDPDINVIYTINEPAAEGAYQAMKNAGKENQALIVSVDGGCPGIASVKSGVIGATSQQYPLLMASKGIEAIVAFAKDGTKPAASDGLTFFNTGVNLVTDKPAEGVPSIDSAKGTELCWG
ncbi:substrate-binding domain-containing protein [Cypionkella sp.]|jgi:fructose transport system substrate-binding protein|uniref:substrate-binding domain-containing protein n=1 Tax=Cypionkella sp. TaxID=2811411 RepID=UPI00274BEF1A|nr:substrate-binding domain-containing protein [Cypionkella sp.]